MGNRNLKAVPKNDLTKTRVLAHLWNNPHSTLDEIAEALEKGKTTIYSHMKNLESEGAVKDGIVIPRGVRIAFHTDSWGNQYARIYIGHGVELYASMPWAEALARAAIISRDDEVELVIMPMKEGSAYEILQTDGFPSLASKMP